MNDERLSFLADMRRNCLAAKEVAGLYKAGCCAGFLLCKDSYIHEACARTASLQALVAGFSGMGMHGVCGIQRMSGGGVRTGGGAAEAAAQRT